MASPKMCRSRGSSIFLNLADFACKALLGMNAVRIEKYKKEIIDRGLDPKDSILVCIDVKDKRGRALAEKLSPDTDWQYKVDKRRYVWYITFADRKKIQKAVDIINVDVGNKLRDHEGFAVVVIGYGTIDVFPLENFSL